MKIELELWPSIQMTGYYDYDSQGYQELEYNGYDLVHEGEILDNWCEWGFREWFNMPDLTYSEIDMPEIRYYTDPYKLVITSRKPNGPEDEYLELVPYLHQRYDAWTGQFMPQVRGGWCLDGDIYVDDDPGDRPWDASIDELLDRKFGEAKRLYVYLRNG